MPRGQLAPEASIPVVCPTHSLPECQVQLPVESSVPSESLELPHGGQVAS